MPIDTLPPEIFDLMCHFLDGVDLARLSQVNKKIQTSTKQHILTKYGFFSEEILEQAKVSQIIFQYICALDKYQFKQKEANEIFKKIFPDIKRYSTTEKNIWANFLAACMYLQGHGTFKELSAASVEISSLIDHYQKIPEDEKNSTHGRNFLISILKLCELYQRNSLTSANEDITTLEKFTNFSNEHMEFYTQAQEDIVANPSSHLIPKI